MAPRPVALVIDPDPRTHEELVRCVQSLGFEVIGARTALEGLRSVASNSPALVLLDVNVPDMTVRRLIGRLLPDPSGVTVIALAEHTHDEAAAEALRAGAADCLEKSPGFERLRASIQRSLPLGVSRLPAGVPASNPVGLHPLDQSLQHLARSLKMRAVTRLVQQVAGTSLSVLIHGEPGVGQELVAKAIHDLSDRASSTWVTVNCASLPAGLLESELFGHEKGAFTGADSRKQGRLERADGGTIFLDEIDEMPLRVQAKVLHVLQANQFFRMGGRDAVTVDVRVTAATTKNLETMVTGGAFREELWYRLNVASIYVPPLRERREEIELLTEHFREKFAKQFNRSVPKLSVETHELLAAYDWPGNIRELENLMKRYVALEDEEHMQGELKARLRITRASAASVAGPPSAGPDRLGLREIARRAAREAERVAIEEVLEKVQYNRAEAARHLQISYKTLLHKLIINGFGRKRPRRKV